MKELETIKAERSQLQNTRIGKSSKKSSPKKILLVLGIILGYGVASLI